MEKLIQRYYANPGPFEDGVYQVLGPMSLCFSWPKGIPGNGVVVGGAVLPKKGLPEEEVASMMYSCYTWLKVTRLCLADQFDLLVDQQVTHFEPL